MYTNNPNLFPVPDQVYTDADGRRRHFPSGDVVAATISHEEQSVRPISVDPEEFVIRGLAASACERGLDSDAVIGALSLYYPNRALGKKRKKRTKRSIEAEMQAIDKSNI